MKKVFMVFCLVFLTGLSVLAQKEAKFSSVSISSGNGPLSSGLFLEANFSLDNDQLGLALGERDLYVFYLKSLLNKKLLAGPCLEYYHGIPTTSLMAIFSPINHWSTFTWLGYSAGTPDMKVELSNWQFLFFYQSLDFNYKRFSATGAILYFDGWMKLLDFKYNQPVTKQISLFTSVGYNFHGDGTALLKMGITFKL